MTGRALILPTTIALMLFAGCQNRERAARPVAQGDGSSAPDSGSSLPGAGDATVVSGKGDAMPDFDALTLDGKPFSFSSRKGRVVLLNVWATWCGPCRYEIPMLKVLHTRYQARGFEVLGVSVDSAGAESDVREFVIAEKIAYPVVLDGEGKSATLLGTTVIPASVLIDRKGVVRWKLMGVIPENDPELLAAIEAALKG